MEEDVRVLLDIIESCPVQGEPNGYSQNGVKVHFNPGSNLLCWEWVCSNEYGSRYGCGIGGDTELSPEQVASLPDWLLESPNWGVI